MPQRPGIKPRAASVARCRRGGNDATRAEKISFCLRRFLGPGGRSGWNSQVRCRQGLTSGFRQLPLACHADKSAADDLAASRPGKRTCAAFLARPPEYTVDNNCQHSIMSPNAPAAAGRVSASSAGRRGPVTGVFRGAEPRCQDRITCWKGRRGKGK